MGGENYFVIDAFFDSEPMQGMESRRDVIKFSFRCDCPGHVVLDDLKFVDALSWQVEVEGITVVQFRLNK